MLDIVTTYTVPCMKKLSWYKLVYYEFSPSGRFFLRPKFFFTFSNRISLAFHTFFLVSIFNLIQPPQKITRWSLKNLLQALLFGQSRPKFFFLPFRQPAKVRGQMCQSHVCIMVQPVSCLMPHAEPQVFRIFSLLNESSQRCVQMFRFPRETFQERETQGGKTWLVIIRNRAAM